MLGIRYHMRQMGEAADVPVGSFLFGCFFLILLFIYMFLLFYVECLLRWRIHMTRMQLFEIE